MDVEARIDALQERVGLLQERVHQLEAAMGMTMLAPPEWGLTPAETRVVGVLLTRDIATKDAVMAALYRDTGRDEAEIKIVDVFVCKIRKKLRPFGFEISTRWGCGYQIEGEMRQAMRAAMTGLAA